MLCEIDINDRGAKVAQMQAMVAQTGKELEVAQDLFKQGFRSKTQLAQAQAAYEAAKAGASTMSIQLANTKIRAPFDGYVDDRYVDVGDYMRVGDKCEMVIAPEPFLAVGAVSEHEVGQIAIGDPASAKLVTGETVQGKVRFVGRSRRCDDAHLPRRGRAAQSGQQAARRRQRRHPHSGEAGLGREDIARHLVLDDTGVVGVRVVENGIVRFLPVQIISDGPDGMWIAGLPDHTAVITVGQQFVTDGERVKTVVDKPGAG